MKSGEGKQLEPGDIVYHQPDYITAGTPHVLILRQTVNGSPLDDYGLFSHQHQGEDYDSARLMTQGQVWLTKEAAVESAARSLEAKARDIRERALK